MIDYSNLFIERLPPRHPENKLCKNTPQSQVEADEQKERAQQLKLLALILSTLPSISSSSYAVPFAKYPPTPPPAPLRGKGDGGGDGDGLGLGSSPGVRGTDLSFDLGVIGTPGLVVIVVVGE